MSGSKEVKCSKARKVQIMMVYPAYREVCDGDDDDDDDPSGADDKNDAKISNKSDEEEEDGENCVEKPETRLIFENVCSTTFVEDCVTQHQLVPKEVCDKLPPIKEVRLGNREFGEDGARSGFPGHPPPRRRIDSVLPLLRFNGRQRVGAGQGDPAAVFNRRIGFIPGALRPERIIARYGEVISKGNRARRERLRRQREQEDREGEEEEEDRRASSESNLPPAEVIRLVRQTKKQIAIADELLLQQKRKEEEQEDPYNDCRTEFKTKVETKVDEKCGVERQHRCKVVHEERCHDM